jgi:hypothetical protein
VWSRSGLVEMISTGTPVTCSIRCKYNRAFTGSSVLGHAHVLSVSHPSS